MPGRDKDLLLTLGAKLDELEAAVRQQIESKTLDSAANHLENTLRKKCGPR